MSDFDRDFDRMVGVARQELIDQVDAEILAPPVQYTQTGRIIVEVVARDAEGRYVPVPMNEKGELLCRDGEKLFLVPLPSTVLIPGVGEVPCDPRLV